MIEVRQWQEKVRNFDKNFITDNGIFFVDCSNIHDYLIPRLSQVIHEVLKFVSDEARKLATEFCDEMKEVLEVWLSCDCHVIKWHIYIEYHWSVYDITQWKSNTLPARKHKVQISIFFILFKFLSDKILIINAIDPFSGPLLYRYDAMHLCSGN